jgi:hypothetical protein
MFWNRHHISLLAEVEIVLREEMEKSLNVYGLLHMRYSGESGSRIAADRLALRRAHLFNSLRDSDKYVYHLL